MSDGREDEKEGKTDSRSYGWHDPEIGISRSSQSKYQIKRNENQN